ncbi:Rossmann fold nucleotide-binding protein [Nocardioides sp.]|uniref:LOG family protein n=1 Tax=Nocardioides sp. TaxID=35761 RepID=UPI001A28F84C|nr:Rossmann fold nucleotide-binding protein [Nocardioides sp.]MBJ7358376.1 Rossmann fold nucleotide-binding protein [Nocardioides sp.]
MRRTRGRVVHIESLEDLDRRLTAGATTLNGWRLHGLDLSGRVDQLLAHRVGGATFLGCRFANGDVERVEAAGGLVLPAFSDVPVDAYRSRLYSADELYGAGPYPDSYDARAYSWSQGRLDHDDLLAGVLHDHAIDDALADWASTRRLVGVMGGHAVTRADDLFRSAARLGHGLGATLTVATGGGPGAMEAANLGGLLAGQPPEVLDEAVDLLGRAPSFRPSVDAWLAPARQVLAGDVDAPCDTLGIPTWHYGHEPTNVFATAIAKYLHNPTREAILLEVCDAGIVFLPGAAGTVQEVFQDACENYYADESSLASMVLVGRTYWTETLPAWPLLRALAQGRPMQDRVHLVDSVEEATELMRGSGSA